MITDLYIPVVATNDNFDYNKEIDPQTYIKMLRDGYYESANDIDQYMKTGEKHVSNRYTHYTVLKTTPDPEIYEYHKVESEVRDINNILLDNTGLQQVLNCNDMFILILNIVCESVDADTDSELMFWLKESIKINNDSRIDDDKKLMILPKRDLQIFDGNLIWELCDCKILDNYGRINKGEFNFAILVNKAKIKR